MTIKDFCLLDFLQSEFIIYKKERAMKTEKTIKTKETIKIKDEIRKRKESFCQ